MGENTSASAPTRRAHVIAVSTSAAAGRAPDTTGPTLVSWLTSLGFSVTGPEVVADGAHTQASLVAALAADPALIVTTGGTGLTPDDQTPEFTQLLIDRRIHGIERALTHAGMAHLPTAALSRGIAGVAGSTLIINLPGSAGAVRDAIETLSPIVLHACDQIADIRTHTRATPPQSTGTSEAPEPPEPAPEPATVIEASITHDPLPTDAGEKVRTDTCGAVVEFAGVIRNHDSGRTGITGLDYTSHPSAQATLKEVVATTSAMYPGTRVWCQHRVGALTVGDTAIIVAVAAAHRAQAFACCAAVVDRVKERVPIWKQQHYAGGGHDWVGIQ